MSSKFNTEARINTHRACQTAQLWQLWNRFPKGCSDCAACPDGGPGSSTSRNANMSSFAMFCCLAWNCEALICTAALHPQGTMGNVAVAQILRSRWGNLRSTELRRVATISSSNPALLETGQSTATSSRMRKTAARNHDSKKRSN